MVADQPAFQLCFLGKRPGLEVMCIAMCTSYPSNLSVLPYYRGGGPTKPHVSSGGTGRMRIGEQ